MKLLIDMNLSPEWLAVLLRAGLEAKHWSEIGEFDAEEGVLLACAREQGFVVLTQDLDFGQLLFRTHAAGPGVVLLRIRNELDSLQQSRICRLLHSAGPALEAGALLVIDEKRARLRRLPM